MSDHYIPFSVPDLGPAEIDAVTRVLESGWLTSGQVAADFEREFAARVGAKHGVAVSSCTAAMHLALEAIGLTAQDEVITSPYTFAATAEVIRYFGARPVFADIDPRTFNLSASALEAAISPRTKAVIPVHVGGLPADMDAISDVCMRHGLKIVEDAAHAFPASHAGRMIGSIGDVTCFSFYATKTITTGEGGMITTDDDAYAERCRLMALHGISKDAWKRYTSEGSWYYEIVAPGYKYNLSDIAAAIGRVQLARATAMRERRLEIKERYDEAFLASDVLDTAPDDSRCMHSWHLYMLRLNLDRSRLDRGAFIEGLKAKGIGTSVHFIPLHLHPYYRDTYGLRAADFPSASAEYMREISIPIYSRMLDEQVDRVIDAVMDLAG